MTDFPILTIDSASQDTRPALEGLRKAFGFVPHIAGAMANSPTLLNAFFAVFGQFRSGTFTPGERQVLLLTNAVTNRCAWAVAFHSALALEDGVDGGTVDALRRAELPGDPRFATLAAVSRALVEKRGHLDAADRGGLADDEVLEVMAGLAVSTMTNYAGNVTRPPLEATFQAYAWAQ